MNPTPSNRSRSPRARGGDPRDAGPWIRRTWPLLLAAILTIAALYVHYSARDLTNSDMEVKILTWYAKLQRHGPLVGIGKDFYNYTPPYVYLLAFATLTSRFITPLTSVKIIALVFDVLCAVVVYKLVRLDRPEGHMPVLAAAVFFAAPTVLLNSAVWGQADSTFGVFMLASLYFLLTNRPLAGMASFASGLAFKPQAIFFVPFLLLLMLWGRIRWYHFFAIPLVYAIWMLPAVMLGRTWPEVLTAYTSQAGATKALTHNAATLYVFVPRSAYTWLLWPAALGAVLVFLGWVYWSWRTVRRPSLATVVLLALVAVTLVPFLLPNMRERYFYLGDALSIVLAFMMPAAWYLPVLFQVFSVLSYSMFLWAAPRSNLEAAALLSLFTLILLLHLQVGASSGSRRGHERPPAGRSDHL